MTLPPLNALRAFEAAGRHNSFAKAGLELHVSANAVSRHVKLLEEHLSLTLFDRKAQGLGLTEVGKQLLPEITEAFHRIDSAAMRARIKSSEIRVYAATTFAVRWLIPRLADFHDLHPRIRVSISLCTDCEQFSEGTYDVGIVQAWWLTRSRPMSRRITFATSGWHRLALPRSRGNHPNCGSLQTFATRRFSTLSTPKTGRRGLVRSANTVCLSCPNLSTARATPRRGPRCRARESQ